MLLWSFEGGRTRSVRSLTILGGHGGGETPLPIPNREVKPASADGTRRAISRESRTPPIFLREPRRRGSLRLKRRGAARAIRDRAREGGARVRRVPDA